ncbi:unnamed protein product, partial [marine sediment metagenome]
FNERAIGFCFLGNFGGNFDGSDGSIPSKIMIDMGVKLVRFLQYKFEIPTEQVLGHRETYKHLGRPTVKTCPGVKIKMDEFRKLL